jgi:hypothetical protein
VPPIPIGAGRGDPELADLYYLIWAIVVLSRWSTRTICSVHVWPCEWRALRGGGHASRKPRGSTPFSDQLVSVRHRRFTRRVVGMDAVCASQPVRQSSVVRSRDEYQSTLMMSMIGGAGSGNGGIDGAAIVRA